MTNSVYSFLGLATKAGKLVSGDETCERLIKSEKALLVIVAGDSSENTKKKFRNMCEYRGIEIRVFGEKELVGKFTGKKIRAVIAISDNGFAKRLMEMIDTCEQESGGGLNG